MHNPAAGEYTPPSRPPSHWHFLGQMLNYKLQILFNILPKKSWCTESHVNMYLHFISLAFPLPARCSTNPKYNPTNCTFYNSKFCPKNTAQTLVEYNSMHTSEHCIYPSSRPGPQAKALGVAELEQNGSPRQCPQYVVPEILPKILPGAHGAGENTLSTAPSLAFPMHRWERLQLVLKDIYCTPQQQLLIQTFDRGCRKSTIILHFRQTFKSKF